MESGDAVYKIIIGSGTGLSPDRRQAITRNNYDSLSFRQLASIKSESKCQFFSQAKT